MLILFSGFTLKSKAQSSCCQITVINEVDCTLYLKLYCNGNLLSCTDCSNSPVSPMSFYYLYPASGCSNSEFYINPGSSSYPSTQTLTVDASLCPCSPFEFEIFGYNFTLNGNTYFDDNHTSDHLNTSGGCCPTGIDVDWNLATCTIRITTPCP